MFETGWYFNWDTAQGNSAHSPGSLRAEIDQMKSICRFSLWANGVNGRKACMSVGAILRMTEQSQIEICEISQF
jgi:hypothetical protein